METKDRIDLGLKAGNFLVVLVGLGVALFLWHQFQGGWEKAQAESANAAIRAGVTGSLAIYPSMGFAQRAISTCPSDPNAPRPRIPEQVRLSGVAQITNKNDSVVSVNFDGLSAYVTDFPSHYEDITAATLSETAADGPAATPSETASDGTTVTPSETKAEFRSMETQTINHSSTKAGEIILGDIPPKQTVSPGASVTFAFAADFEFPFGCDVPFEGLTWIANFTIFSVHDVSQPEGLLTFSLPALCRVSRPVAAPPSGADETEYSRTHPVVESRVDCDVAPDSSRS